ncbi:MAG: sce7726 family protein [Lachnospiraceae bacterium]|nr:sce7726 family protein [Lachnospiraceae bacterium]
MLYDKDIREPLFDYLEERYGKVRIIEEKQMGRSRADIVMVLPGEIAGVEIKSDADTYTRLERQVKDYDKFFDKNYVVVGSTHAMHIEEHVPEYWGILSVEWLDERVDFYTIREATKNPKLKRKCKIQILWRPELAHIQELCSMPKYAQKSKDFVRNKIVEQVPEEILDKMISEELFQRDYTEIKERIGEFRRERRKRKQRNL